MDIDGAPVMLFIWCPLLAHPQKTMCMTQLQERMDIDGAPVVLFIHLPLLAHAS